MKELAFIAFFIYLLSLFQVTAQSDTVRVKKQKQKPERDVSLFGSEKILKVSLYLDLAAFAKKPSKSDSFDADLMIHLNEIDTVKRHVKIKYRGISRFELCSFPPMELKFKNPLLSDSADIRKLKLVTHCQSSNINDEYVLREYLVYKLFNAFTDTSFRVRLLRVSYIDSKGDKKTIVKYGIFIEPIEMVAKRTNSTVVKSGALNQNLIIPYDMDRLAIFNYMVTNWDWSIPGQHNVEVLKSMSYGKGSLGIAIPYDFDLTGVVNADYAIPPPGLGIDNVRQPIFYGICRTKEVYIEDLKIFQATKEKLYSIVNEFPYLNQRAKKDITFFLDNFFDQLDKPKSMNNLADIFLNSCKK